MSGTPRHGRNAAVFLDCTTAGTQAVGTSTLTQLTGRNQWLFDQSTDFVDTTSFGDTSKNAVSGLPNATGDINGNWDSSGVGTLLYNVIGASSERGMMVFPDYQNNKTDFFSGKAFISVKSGGGVTAAVSMDLHFEAGPTGIVWSF